ncbi:UNVERIFIED_CONTAM: hypothetical protein HDU68_010878 [Siphonaria sp. JEL0065]|nr:hypothetical protein HDU68_010878 [Siphonaria sp. JEL0065]
MSLERQDKYFLLTKFKEIMYKSKSLNSSLIDWIKNVVAKILGSSKMKVDEFVGLVNITSMSKGTKRTRIR